MTDTELKRRKAICEVANVADIGDLSDGFHTFNSLYYQRMILFASLVRAYKDRAWKSYRHEDGELCFGGGWFIVGIDTPEGSYTYHYENKYFDRFDCVELTNGKHWDGHTEDDVTRLLSLPTILPDDARVKATLFGGDADGYADGFPVYSTFVCSVCGEEFGVDDGQPPPFNYCPECGAKFYLVQGGRL